MGRQRAKPKDDLLVVHLASGLSVVKAAKRVGMSESTARSRVADPAFRARVDQAKGEIVAEAVATLGHSMTAAASELAKLLKSRDERVKLRAATALLAIALRARQAEDLERQLAEVVERLNRMTADGRT